MVSKLDDPAQAANAVTVGGMTRLCDLPPELPDHAAIAPEGGISPHTRAGYEGRLIKPDILLEAGNQAFDGALPELADTMAELSTSNKLDSPLTILAGTSLATAIAGRYAALISNSDSSLRPSTVRGLLIHAARWTGAMLSQFPALDQRLAICGYGTPNLEYCLSCTQERATIIVEDSIPNSYKDSEEKKRRLVKYFRLPSPEFLQELGDQSIELAVTLSYFAEPNLVRGRLFRGLDLQWDMQGPTESDDEFMERIDLLKRDPAAAKPETTGFPWQVGKQRRSRGTVQSDRWEGPASWLAGSRLVAVSPCWAGGIDVRRSKRPSFPSHF